MALVHRDVSPQNVLISFDGDIKLCDFGIAKAASKASHTRAGALKGKLQYMSPEQAWGKDIDHRSDIFSLGLVLYEMLTGRKGFAGDSELSILEQVRSPQLDPAARDRPGDPARGRARRHEGAQGEPRGSATRPRPSLASELGNILQVIRPAPGAAELGAFLADLRGPRPPGAARRRPAPRRRDPPPPPGRRPRRSPRSPSRPASR